MLQKKTTVLKFLLIVCILVWLYPLIIFSSNFLDEEKIKYDLQRIQKSENINSNQQSIIDFLQSALHFINEGKLSNNKIKEYQQIINNFSCIALQLREEYDNVDDRLPPDYINQNLSIHELKQKLFQVNNQLMDLSEQLKQEEDQVRSIHESLKLLPQQQFFIKNTLNHLEQRQQIFFANVNTPLAHAKFIAFQSEQSANRLKIIELEFAQLSSSNRKELAKLRIALLKKKYDYTDNMLQILRNQLNYLRHKETNQAITYTEKILSEQSNPLPKSIKNQLQNNYDLSFTLTQQTCSMNDIAAKKRKVEANILQVHQTLSDLIEQSQWVGKSPALGETLRSQISRLPKIPKFQQLDNDMAQLRAKRLQYENNLNRLSIILTQSKQDDGTILTTFQKHILEKQLNIQRGLISSLLNSYDAQILELTKLKLSYEQLEDALQEIQQATHRYLFWIADIYPITISYPIDVYQDILRILSDNTLLNQMISAFHMIYLNRKILIFTIFCIIIALGLYVSMRYRYFKFLEQSSKCVGKVNQDNFLITFYNIWSSMFIALPIPIVWMIIGYNFNHSWPYTFVVSIGEAMNSTLFMLWAFIVSAYFASPNGLFIVHFGWSQKRIQQVFSKNYAGAVIIIIFLTMALTVFNNYNNREFSNTIGRLCFILLCIYLTYITNNVKRSRLSLLYSNQHYSSSKNLINYFLWNILIAAPIISAIACAFGYSFAAQELLARLETSLFIWILLLIIYHIIRRWMCIQQRRIAFEQTKKKRAKQLAFRTYNKLTLSPNKIYQQEQLLFTLENNKKILDLDTISTQSLQLIRSIITLIALLLMTFLWSELKFAFSFLENITLWDVTSTIKGVENIQPITLNSFLTVIVVIIITTITVRNLPSFLELTLLQYCNFTPGTGYAITTLTKYILMLLGGLIGFSLIGIEWVKIQWLVAALGVGLGFGLQEIFANFISGLMILFEKPIRIGDTITIKNFTGNVTKINTRATIITNWDHKEIIIPNKEFITKKFINWSLSNTITRITLRVPAPSQINTRKMTNVLIQIVKNTSLALEKPVPEVYLADLKQGLPVFEIRVYTSDIKSRIPLCHQINTGIMDYYNNNKLELPKFPLYFCKESNFDVLFIDTPAL